jgi:shikimate kinase
MGGEEPVGRASRSLGWAFVDTDADVESGGHEDHGDLAREGEAGFQRASARAGRASRTPLRRRASGGGAVVADENRRILAEKGVLVWLDAPPETLAGRIDEALERPLLAGLDRAGRIAKLAALRAERAPAYGTARIRVETDARTVDEVCAEIRAALGHGAAA